jgi:hypothetical protein
MHRFAQFFERFMQALHASRELEAARVVRRHAHFLAEAEDYERGRAVESAGASDVKAAADARLMIAQVGMHFVPWSAP